MIELKTVLHGWIEVDKKHAFQYALNIWNGAVNMTAEQKVDWINSRFRGIAFTESILREANNERRN